MEETFRYANEDLTIELTDEFKKAYDVMENTKQSIFITGKAGSGKSTLLKYFRSKTKKNVAVLSFTGLAAINVDGSTIHSFFAFPISFLEPKSIIRNNRIIDILKGVDTIIIDEVSMVRADLMDAIDKSLRIHRGVYRPFGDVQMIFIGDLYQLAPIIDKDLSEVYGHFYKSPFFFSANVFQTLRLPLINLEKIHRQKDPILIEVLNNIRERKDIAKTLEQLNQHITTDFTAVRENDTIVLCTTNHRAKKINDLFLDQLKTPTYSYNASIDGKFDPGSYPAESILTLKEGAKVIFIKNDKDKLFVNGEFGIVRKIGANRIEIESKDKLIRLNKVKWEKIKYKLNKITKKVEKEVIGTFEQYPIKLAWAVSIHKSQGQTYDRAVIDLDTGAFTHGQTYVALSRCKTFEGIKLKRPILESDVILDERIFDVNMYFEEKI